jgi:ABC-type taurine transport system ATPase subunit
LRHECFKHRRSHRRRRFGFGLGANGVREREPERLMRIVVVGTSGAGKTTLARKIAAVLELQHIELDAINWRDGAI